MPIKLDKLKRLEKQFRADIRWAIAQGPGWAPDIGAGCVGVESGKRHFAPIINYLTERACGTCALGAHLIRHKRKYLTPSWSPTNVPFQYAEVTSISRSLRVPELWAYHVFMAVTDDPHRQTLDEHLRIHGPDNTSIKDFKECQAVHLGWRLRNYGDAYEILHKNKRRGKKAKAR